MFYKYEIKKEKKNSSLYLYLTMSYEFSKELTQLNSDELLGKKINNFIKDNNISYNGDKVYLVVDDIIIKAVDIKNIEDNIEVLATTKSYSDNDFIVKIKLDNDVIVEISLKEYLLGVLASNALSNLEEETLKALCILYITYAFKMMKENNIIDSTNNFVTYRPISYYKLLWITEYNKIYSKLLDVIIKTNKEFITYQNNYILPFVHLCNNGYTTSSLTYPYLVKRSSLWDYASSFYLTIKDIDYNTLEKKLNMRKEDIKNINILEITDSNNIKSIKIGSRIFTGDNLKVLLDLNSSDITIIINEDSIRFITRGKGNNLGFSQFGANEIAKTGSNYVQLLKYYFPTTSVKKYK